MASIYLSRKNLHEIPVLKENIKRITLEGNQITSIKTGLPNNIVYMNMKKNIINYIEELPEKLRTINLSFNRLSSINFLDHKLITFIDLSYNSLTTITRMPINLVELNLSNNVLHQVPENLPKSLKRLDLSGNYIDELKGIPEKIEYLDATNNNIEYIEILGEELIYLSLKHNALLEFNQNLENVEVIDISFNQIKNYRTSSLKIRSLDLSNNNIENFPNVPESIEVLKLSFNKISNLPVKISKNLNYFDVEKNNITYIPAYYFIHPKLEEFFYDYGCFIPNAISTGVKVYEDNENTHSRHIQETLRKSIERLSETESVEYFSIHDNENISTDLKDILIELVYSDDMLFGSTTSLISEIFFMVWSRINKHKDAEEIKRIMENDLLEADDLSLCPIGKISRVVNSLSGFFDDIEVNISENEQIMNIIISMKKKDLSHEEEKKKIIEELLERKFSKNKIDEWVMHLEE